MPSNVPKRQTWNFSRKLHWRFLNARNSSDDTVLSIVVNHNRLDCCEVICKRCPSLLYHQPDQKGNTPLHIAAYSGNLDILKLLISACDKADQGGDRVGKQKALTLRSISSGNNTMHMATHGSQPKSVKLLIEANPNKELLRAGDNSDNTPLHLAVGLKSDYEIARLLIKADPDFPYGVNSFGESPLLIAIDKAELHNDREMLELILELQPTQSKVSVNEIGWTALHYCVSKKYLNTIGHIIQSCPESSPVADNEGQNFFHHAVKFGNVNMVKHILGMKEITSSVLNSPNNLGRTPLDVAAVSKNECMILCLYVDPRVNKKLTVTKNLNWVVEKHNFLMMNLFMMTNADLLMNIELEVFQNSVDEEGDTILFKAALKNDLFLCKELYKRCPSLIYHQSKGGRTALHHAASRGEPEMLKFLIAAGANIYNNEYAEDDIESGDGEKNPQKMLLTMLDDEGDTALHKAVVNHKLEAVKLLVEADPDWTLLHQATSEGYLSIIEDIIKFCPSCLDVVNNEGKNFLHIAAKLGKIDVVRLFLKEKDIPFTVLNHEDKDGNTPFHIAAITGNVPLIRCILFDPRVIKTMPQRGENGWTFLHQATFNGDLSIIEDIIKFYPSCLDVVDNEGKNFLHIAAKFGKINVVRLFLKEKDVPFTVLNHEDKEGNTPFHIAALTGNEELARCFLFDPRVIKTTVNKDGQHVLRAIKFPYDKWRAGVVDIAGIVNESDLKEQRDFDLVVGALIATVSFTAGITVPGGYNSDEPNKGTAVFSKEVSFTAFIISNTLALIFSLYAVFSHFCARRMLEEANIIYQLKVATYCTLAAIYCMTAAFIAGSFAVLANSNWLAIVVCIICCLFFIFACRPMWKIAMQRKHAASASQYYTLVSP